MNLQSCILLVIIYNYNTMHGYMNVKVATLNTVSQNDIRKWQEDGFEVDREVSTARQDDEADCT